MLQLMHELGACALGVGTRLQLAKRGRVSGRKPGGWPALRQSGFQNLGLGFLYIVLEAAQFNRADLKVVNHISGTRITVSRLSNTADVDEIFFPFSTVNLSYLPPVTAFCSRTNASGTCV